MEGLRETVVMDFSGVYGEENFWKKENPLWLDFGDVSGTSCYCDPEAGEEIRRRIRNLPCHGIHFLDSGNYHYLSLFWMEKMQKPFRLLVFDNHTDMQSPAFGGLLSCGSWVREALEELPLLREVMLVGPEEEAFLQIEEVLRARVRFVSRERLRSKEGRCGAWPGKCRDLPIYLSVDKDILCPADACTGWSQGDTSLENLLAMAEEAFVSCPVCGMDVCGERDPRQRGSSEANDRANRELLSLAKKYGLSQRSEA